ncbi:SDR family NAD(P)-dependent oxidoreductase [Stappia sp. GBMRC 2046]|uniref:SDR family NAD(P)-dependent oxidoreductase n=1 Tax=Stappia sediminis TaxID=2692190 RepID=A0A7X3S877_9HYPH|nr:NAD-dependent 4,6-dehydratase LegB [Stappia sediminis]MXN65578.1 SDR family NAD(P)-dependent oxidoreductase [Stappia sediminis]
MSLNGKKVLITGADGFIGSHVVEALVCEGAKVRAFVLYNSFDSWGWLDRISPDVQGHFDIFAGDVRDPNGVREAMKDVDIVLHLAALIAIPYSYHSPDTYVDTNVKGTLNIVKAATDLGIERVVCTSTSEVYGTAQFVPITEDHPLVGQSPYSASKIGADQIALSFYRSFETPVTIIRPFNTYGPRQSTRAVIPTIITQIASGAREVRLGKMSPTRDFSFVRDMANAFLVMAEADGVLGEVVNFGSGFEISIERTGLTIASLMGQDVAFISENERMRPERSEVDRLWAGIDKSRELTDWAPSYGGEDGFLRGLAETIEWFQDPDNLALYKSGRYTI